MPFKQALEQTSELFSRGEAVYDQSEKDHNGILKKTKYWVCCHRTEKGEKQYRLKDKEPKNWNEVECDGQHEGHWVGEGNLLEW